MLWPQGGSVLHATSFLGLAGLAISIVTFSARRLLDKMRGLSEGAISNAHCACLTCSSVVQVIMPSSRCRCKQQ